MYDKTTVMVHRNLRSAMSSYEYCRDSSYDLVLCRQKPYLQVHSYCCGNVRFEFLDKGLDCRMKGTTFNYLLLMDGVEFDELPENVRFFVAAYEIEVVHVDNRR